jgi:hypothetical protein
MLNLEKLDNLVINAFVVIILVLIDMIFRFGETMDILYLLFICGCFIDYLWLKYKK